MPHKNLRYIRIASRTEKVCRLACEDNGDMLKYVPKNLLTKELCLIACRNSRYELKYVP